MTERRRSTAEVFGPDEHETTRLILIRHGEAHTNVNGIIGGHDGCTGLTDTGREQVTKLRDRLARTNEIKADVLYSSILSRAVETAEIIAPAIGAPDLVQDCDVCELHVGEADGLHADEYIERFGFEPWSTDLDRPMAPGAESWNEFMDRTARALRRLVDDHPGQTIVVACHGGTIEGAMVSFGGKAPNGYRPFDLRTVNSSITEWEWRLPGGDIFYRPSEPGRWRLVRYNDFAHLML